MSVIPFSKRMENKNTVLIQYLDLLDIKSCWFLDKTNKLLAMQVSFKKALAQSFTRHCCSSKKTKTNLYELINVSSL